MSSPKHWHYHKTQYSVEKCVKNFLRENAYFLILLTMCEEIRYVHIIFCQIVNLFSVLK